MKALLFVFQLFVIAPAILGEPLGMTFPDLSTSSGWGAQPLGQVVGGLILLVAVGVVLAAEGYRLLDECLHGELRREQDVNAAKPADRHEG